MLDYSVLISELREGRAVLVAGSEHGIPTIHDIGNGPNCKIKTDSEVVHHGFGFFSARVKNEAISFDAGGAMRREEDYSWTPLRASASQLESMGYDIQAVLEILESK